MPVQELENFRKKYPDYGDMDDATLANKLASKYPEDYGDLPGKVSATAGSSKESPGVLSKLGSAADYVFHAPVEGAKAAVGLASGMGASIAGKLAGEATAAFQGVRGNPNYGKTAQDVRGKVTEALTYQPRTEPARQAVGLAGTALDYTLGLPQKGIDWIGDKATEAGYPNLGYQIKDIGESLLMGAGTKAGMKMMKPVVPEKAFNKLKQTITENYNKAVRPSVSGKATAGRIAKGEAKAVDAVISIVENKDNIQFVDKEGNALPPGKLPSGKREALGQFGQAIEQTKKGLHDQFIQMREAAGNTPESLNPVIKFLDDTLAKDAERLKAHPGLKQYIENKRDVYGNIGQWDLRTINDEITSLNAENKAFYRNPTPGMHNHKVIDAGIAYTLNKIMDDAITKSEGPGAKALRNKMGSLIAIEPEVAHRTVIDARKNPKGIFELTSPFILFELAVNAAKWNPAGLFAAGAAYMTKRHILGMNNPNRMVEKMFKGVDKKLPDAKMGGTLTDADIPPLSPGNQQPFAEGIPMTDWSGLKMERGLRVPQSVEGIPIPGTGGGSGLMTEAQWNLLQRMKGQAPMPLLTPEFMGGKSVPPSGIVGPPSVVGTPGPQGMANFYRGTIPETTYAPGSRGIPPDTKVYWVSEEAKRKAAAAARAKRK